MFCLPSEQSIYGWPLSVRAGSLLLVDCVVQDAASGAGVAVRGPLSWLCAVQVCVRADCTIFEHACMCAFEYMCVRNVLHVLPENFRARSMQHMCILLLVLSLFKINCPSIHPSWFVFPAQTTITRHASQAVELAQGAQVALLDCELSHCAQGVVAWQHAGALRMHRCCVHGHKAEGVLLMVRANNKCIREFGRDVWMRGIVL